MFRHFAVVTTSVFVSSGDSLKVKTIVQGPITHVDISSSSEVLAAAMRLDKLGKDKKGLFLNRHTDLDFEDLYDDQVDDGYVDQLDDAIKELIDDMDDGRFQDYYYMDDDDGYQFMIDDEMDPEEIQEIEKKKEAMHNMTEDERKHRKEEKMNEKKAKLEEFKKRREEKHRIIEEHKKKKAQEKKAQHKPRSETGVPVENTFEIHEDGWYRFCVEAIDATVSTIIQLSLMCYTNRFSNDELSLSYENYRLMLSLRCASLLNWDHQTKVQDTSHHGIAMIWLQMKRSLWINLLLHLN